MKTDNDQKPLVSIIVRTCGRPNILKNALKSIQEQDYPNIEVVLVEDGENISEEYAHSKYPDLDIQYSCSGEKVGRCQIGNIGMQIANGQYLNFLDDDDYLLSNHVSTLVEALLENKTRVAYSIAEEHQIKKDKRGSFRVKRRLVRYKQQFSRLLLCYKNYFPIQSVMFDRELYLTEGGFDLNSEFLEDWDLWLRFSMASDFLFVPEITSVYHTPYKGKKKNIRDIELKKSREYFEKKHETYIASMSASQIRQEMNYIINIYCKKRILYYAQKVRDYLLYRDM